jgi:hypothetical protein
MGDGNRVMESGCPDAHTTKNKPQTQTEKKLQPKQNKNTSASAKTTVVMPCTIKTS